MTDRLSPERETEIRARAKAATPGPWERYERYGPNFYANVTGSQLRGVGDLDFGGGEEADADREFVAHASEDIPALLAELAAVRAERDKARVHRDDACADLKAMDRKRPTHDAYDAACKALWKHRERAVIAEAERDAAKVALREACDLVAERDDEIGRLSAEAGEPR